MAHTWQMAHALHVHVLCCMAHGTYMAHRDIAVSQIAAAAELTRALVAKLVSMHVY